jgi:hypothetical protein
VPSPKTAHHEGKDSRVIPIFPELMPYLRDAFDAAEPGTEYIINRHRDSNANRAEPTRAAGKAAQQPHATTRRASHAEGGPTKNPAIRRAL